MKWIGEHIWSFKSRFRNDVYVENSAKIYMGTIETMDTNGKVTVADQSNITSLGTLTNLQVDDINLNGKTISILGDTDDTFSIVTSAAGATKLTTLDNSGSNGNFEIEADGDITLDAAGDILLYPDSGDQVLVGADDFLIMDSTSTKPDLILQNQTNDEFGPNIILRNKRIAPGAQPGQVGDELGRINFQGNNDGTPTQKTFASIVGISDDVVTGSEAGLLEFQVAEYDGTVTTGLKLDGDTNVDGEIDVTIANGVGSQTTIQGDLTVVGDVIKMNNLPTSDPAVAGQLWSNSGVLTISSG